MENPWIIHGLSMDDPCIIHELPIDYPWVIHGLSMDYPWIIHGLSMDNPWASMDFHGLPGAGETSQHILGEPLGRMWGNRSAGVPERIPDKESKNPFMQAWFWKNM